MLNTPTTRMRRILIVRSTGGSVEHFYHFFFAVLVPLLDRIRRGTLEGASVLRSCGPMDPHLRLLQEHGLAKFRLLQKELISRLLTRIPHNLVETLHSEECYDERGVRADGYRPEVLHPVRAFCIDCFTSDAPALDVLLVERGEPDPFYLSPRSEIRGGARLRRSVPNADELAEALIRSGRQVTRMRPETLGLRDQIRAFSRAKVVVAQHGAALSNVLWMASGSRVVEIIPRKKDPRDHFSRIAGIVAATYAFVHQDGNHAPVKPQTLLEAVNVRPV